MAYADVDEAFIHQMSPQKFGVFSETVFVLLCQNAGIDARRPLEIKRGRLVKTDRFDVLTDVFGRVEVKASRLSVKGRVQFGNMRPDDADTFVWQAHLPGQTRMWVVPSSVVPKLRGVQDSTGVSYGISRTSERRFGVSFKATDIPEWMAVYEVTDFRTLMSPWRRSVGR